ncbi:protein phosphatase 1 regulatory subunit 3A/B/C/D/E [Sarotherodon galilaeus]
MDVTNPYWAPTLHMGHDDIPVSKWDRHVRRMQRKRKRALIGGFRYAAAESEGVPRAEVIDEDLTEDQQQNHHVMEAVDRSCVGQVEVEVPAANVDSGDRTDSVTEAKGQTKDCVCNEQGRAEINRLLEENRLLRSQYYTGLPCYAILLSLFNTVKDFLPVLKKLSGFQMLLLTLMRLRRELPVQHLCHLFDMSHKTLSSIFADTIDVLYARLGVLVHWPERHCLQATMPPQFSETFGKRVAIIVDCFEIRTERPSNLKARAQTYSHYKGTHTIKYVIGITPHGSISFISKGLGGGGVHQIYTSPRDVAFFKGCYRVM